MFVKMENGWISLHRKLLDNPICKKPHWGWLWVVLLLLANHEENESFIWNNETTILKAGQFITGRKKLKDLTGIPESTIEDILKYLEKQQQIQQQKTTKFRLITILNWDKYQKGNKKPNNRATTEQQQSDTFNNDNNDNNVITTKVEQSSSFGKTEINQLWEYGQTLGFPATKQTLNRYAINRLLKGKTVEQLKKAAEFSQQIRDEAYAPQVNNWLDLEEKYLKLRDWVKRQQPKESKTLIL